MRAWGAVAVLAVVSSTAIADEPAAEHFARAEGLRAAGDCRGALEAYRAFLEAAPAHPEAPLAKRRMGECAAALDLQARRVSFEAPRRRFFDDVGLTLSVGGAALIGVGVFAWMDGLALEDEIASGETEAGRWMLELMHGDRADFAIRFGQAAVVAGTVMLGGGAARFLSRPEPGAVVTAVVDREGATVWVAGTF